jgi:hypothetical protein
LVRGVEGGVDEGTFETEVGGDSKCLVGGFAGGGEGRLVGRCAGCVVGGAVGGLELSTGVDVVFSVGEFVCVRTGLVVGAFEGR